MCLCSWLKLATTIAAAWLAAPASGAQTEAAQEAAAAKPLNHTVRVQRTGRLLKLDYQLIGADGQEYRLWDLTDQAQPAFAIYQDGVQLGGGTFEFG